MATSYREKVNFLLATCSELYLGFHYQYRISAKPIQYITSNRLYSTIKKFPCIKEVSQNVLSFEGCKLGNKELSCIILYIATNHLYCKHLAMKYKTYTFENVFLPHTDKILLYNTMLELVNLELGGFPTVYAKVIPTHVTMIHAQVITVPDYIKEMIDELQATSYARARNCAVS